MTAVLLDTQIFIWMRLRPNKLTAGERQIIDTASARCVSAVNLWEIAILQGLRRIEADRGLLEPPAEFTFLSITQAHCVALLELPHHHRDPFDRMLIAQAKSERVALLTRDRIMAEYHEHATILRNPPP